MRVVFMGTPEFSVATLEAIVAAGHEVAMVYSQPPRKAGRGQKPRPSPVQKCAERHGIPVRVPVNFKAEDCVKAFEDLNADVAVVVAYGLLLPQALLDAPLLGCVNVHASLLPRWRGAAPIHRAVEAGDAETGVCIMQMEAGLDTGPVIARAATAIGPSETTGELHDRLAVIGADALTQVLARAPWIATPQPETGVTYAKKIDKAECVVDWSQPAQAIVRQINAFSPFPGAYSTVLDERLKLLKAEVAEGREVAEGMEGEEGAVEPGEILSDLTIAAGEGIDERASKSAIRVLRAQRAGKSAMDANDVLRGWPALLPGTAFS